MVYLKILYKILRHYSFGHHINNQDFPRICKTAANIRNVFIGPQRLYVSNEPINVRVLQHFRRLHGRPRTAVSRPRFHAGCVVRKGCCATFTCMDICIHIFFPVWELYSAEGNMQLSFATFLLKCHGITRKEMYVDTVTRNVQIQFSLEGFR